jgi:hypothetical protein
MKSNLHSKLPDMVMAKKGKEIRIILSGIFCFTNRQPLIHVTSAHVPVCQTCPLIAVSEKRVRRPSHPSLLMNTS